MSSLPHWIVAPIIIPIVSAMGCLLVGEGRLALKRGIGFAGVSATLLFAFYMMGQAWGGDVTVYELGNWPVPFGIVFVLDRLSALMVLLTNVLAWFAYLYAIQGDDTRGPSFHMLFLMQITGVNGAFLTGDAFNLFVFFEIMLLTAYVLVLYGSGKARTRAGLYYVFLNLVGSSIFLVAVGVLYALTGTLNMADMALKMSEVTAEHGALLKGAALMWMVVFAIKGGLFPLYFWLPRAYASVTAPVAAIFAIMTKVGVYAMLRTGTLMFGPERGLVSNLVEPYLMPMGLTTLALGVAGALGATRQRSQLAYLLLASVGTIFAGVALHNEAGIAGALYYMVHSTLIMAAFFMLADLIHLQRGAHSDYLRREHAVREPVKLGLLYLVCTVAAAGLPPLTGFLGKALILRAGIESAWLPWLWSIVLAGSFFTLIALVRSGTALFWGVEPAEGGEGGDEASQRIVGWRAAPIVGVLACLLALTVWGGDAVSFAEATAAQLLAPQNYINAVFERGAP